MKELVCCVAGKSGGHLIPCLSYAESKYPAESILLFTTKSKLDNKISKSFASISHQIPLPILALPHNKWTALPIFSWQLLRTCWKSFYFLIKHRPKVIISTGGLISVPVCLIGHLLGIRVELFELNVVPGRAVFFLTKFINTINICFTETKEFLKKSNCNLIPYPLKAACYAEQLTRAEALKNLNFSSERKTILILGGSQGSQSLNRIVLDTLKATQLTNLQVIHQVGNNSPEHLKPQYEELGIISYVFKFHTNLEQLYPAADLVICRSGAGTLFETYHFKKQCITIPLEADSTDHQVDNALAFSKKYPKLFTTIRQNEPQTINPLILKFLARTSRGRRKHRLGRNITHLTIEPNSC